MKDSFQRKRYWDVVSYSLDLAIISKFILNFDIKSLPKPHSFFTLRSRLELTVNHESWTKSSAKVTDFVCLFVSADVCPSLDVGLHH